MNTSLGEESCATSLFVERLHRESAWVGVNFVSAHHKNRFCSIFRSFLLWNDTSGIYGVLRGVSCRNRAALVVETEQDRARDAGDQVCRRRRWVSAASSIV